ncbi:hypothetical protein IFR05_010570 [Cadophora sp. M221]|nr:hypothetical protein IFR05_010570 [Cadophora sp. M221]
MSPAATPPHLDVEAVRKQFPGLASGAICMNNGSGALVYKGAIESIARTMSAPHMNLRGFDSKSMVDVKQRTAQYAKIASFMNAAPDEIDSEIIVSVLCHEAGATAWVALAKSLGVSIKWWVPEGGMRNNHDPKLSTETLRPLLSPKTRLVCCGHVSNITGTIEKNVKAVAELVHTIPGALILVDGVAWAPHRPIDVKQLGVDFYVFSWYKVFGPHIAQIYASRDVQKQYLTSLNHYFFDATSLSVRLGLGNSCIELEHALPPIITYLTEDVGWDALIAHEEVITSKIIDYLSANRDLYTIYGCQSADPLSRVSLISFTVNGIPSDKVAKRIHESSSIRLITGDCWSPRTVFDVLGLPEYGVIRASLVHYNTLEEIEMFVQKLDEVVRDLKR